ncbi:MAG: tetratricopeptide repeat protein [Alphaproteobacteria bacterium]
MSQSETSPPQDQSPGAAAPRERFELGLALHRQGKLGEAAHIYAEILERQPNHFDALHLLGVAAVEAGRTERGIELIRSAIGLNDQVAEAHSNLGNALQVLKRHQEAVACYDKAIALKPDFPDVHLNRGVALTDLRRLDEAVASFGRAIALDPDNPAAYSNRGVALRELGRAGEALVDFDRALALNPRYAKAYSNRGNALLDLRRFDEAVASCDAAIALDPRYADAHNNRGIALQYLKRPADAVASFDRAIVSAPDFPVAYNNRGNALQDLKRHAEAIASFEKAISLKPDYADAYWNESLCYLVMGKFEQGWPLYEWRKRRAGSKALRSYRQPLWSGTEAISGKTVFVYWEQGFGDTIQFCRYAVLLAGLGAKVVLSVQDPLKRLLAQFAPTIRIIGPDERPVAFDFHIPLLSLPLALRTTLATIPARPHYLRADERARLEWAARLPPATKPRIGVAWSGNTALRNDYSRSIDFSAYAPLLTDKFEWHCLQKEIRSDELSEISESGRIKFHGERLSDFGDTAALLDLMDLVVTVDTSVAHLAGAMGKPVWILLPVNPDWRWLLDRKDSPWYPSARLFRQRESGNWADVIARVAGELRSLYA